MKVNHYKVQVQFQQLVHHHLQYLMHKWIVIRMNKVDLYIYD